MEEKRNTMWAYIITAALILITIIYASVDVYYMYMAVYIWFGFAYGMMLQYGRFCFASASRDLFAAGVPRMAVGIMVALMFFSLIQAILESVNMSTFHAAPFGIHMLLSGSVFGIGMCLAGGCASGSLYKVGEGNMTSLLAVIFGLCLGQAIFVDVGGVFLNLVPQAWADKAAQYKAYGFPISSWFDYYLTGYVWHQPQYTIAKLISGGHPGTIHFFLGNALINAILPAIVLMCVIYYFYPRKVFMKKKKKALKKAGKEPVTGFGDEIEGLWSMITASKRTSLMGILVGITAGLHILTMAGMQKKFGVTNFGELLKRMGHTADVSMKGTVFDPGYWYITSQEGQLGAWILEKFGWNMHDNMFFGYVNGLPELWRNPALWMSLGIIFGAMVMDRLTNEYTFKVPSPEL
ncbi:MAG: YeeE/YedE family protein, partial [Deltaproteobacteria bacterium]|nr:YeeE/YedE family protein [Deltaproteobacteria bacterium]